MTASEQQTVHFYQKSFLHGRYQIPTLVFLKFFLSQEIDFSIEIRFKPIFECCKNKRKIHIFAFYLYHFLDRLSSLKSIGRSRFSHRFRIHSMHFFNIRSIHLMPPSDLILCSIFYFFFSNAIFSFFFIKQKEIACHFLLFYYILFFYICHGLSSKLLLFNQIIEHNIQTGYKLLAFSIFYIGKPINKSTLLICLILAQKNTGL